MILKEKNKNFDYIIRKIQEEDSTKILTLVLEMADESQNFPFTSDDYGMSFENQRSFINYMSQMKNCIYLGAFIDQEPIGLIYLEGGRRLRTAHICNLGMGIRKSCWNQGVGTALVQEALAFAMGNPAIAKIDLQVRTDNMAAITLYKKAGFQVEGKNKRALFIDGVFYDYLFMGRPIDEQ